MQRIRTLTLTLLFFLASMLVHCKKENFYTSIIENEEPPAIDITIKKFTAEGYKKANLKWNLEAETSYLSYATSNIKMKIIRLVYFENPKDTSNLSSDEGNLNRTTNDMILEKNVVVKSSNGRELYTEKLLWDSKKEELSTDQPVKILYPNGEVIRGSGMRSDGTLTKIVIYKPVGVHSQRE